VKVLHRFAAAVLLAVLLGSTLAQPGSGPPEGLVIKVAESGRLSAAQLPRLVWIENARASRTDVFTSGAGRRHLRFSATIEGSTYAAIMYDGDWTNVDRERLDSGAVHLLGLWDTFQGEPSLVVKWVETLDGSYALGALPSRPPNAPTVRIESARTSGVDKFVSSTLRMHARFTFTVDGQDTAYHGIVYEGVWTTALLDRLRIGSSHLIGYWDERNDAPFFVVTEVE